MKINIFAIFLLCCSYAGHYLIELGVEIIRRKNDDVNLYEQMSGIWLGNPGTQGYWY